MSAISFPNLWLPRRPKRWTPWGALFSGVPRQSDGSIGRATDGSIARDDGGCVNCGCPSSTPCNCSADGLTSFGGTLLITFSSLVVPTGTCLNGQIQYSAISPNGTFCLPYNSTSGGGVCLYNLFDATLATYVFQSFGGCAGAPGFTGLEIAVGTQWVLGTAATITVSMAPNAPGAATPNPVFKTAASVTLPCGGSVVIANSAQYTAGGPPVNVGGSVTVTDATC